MKAKKFFPIIYETILVLSLCLFLLLSQSCSKQPVEPEPELQLQEDPEPEPEPEPRSEFPIWGGVCGQFHWHGALTPELNEDLSWQIVRWKVSSWVIDSIGWSDFRDSLLDCLTPQDVKILLCPRWNSPNFDPPPADLIQDCVPSNWDDWWAFCYQIGSLLKDDRVWFQIGNEPDYAGHKYWSGTIPEFIQYVNCGAEAIREANPEAFIVCGGFTGGKQIDPIIREVVEGVKDNVDALDRHFYGLDLLSEPEVEENLTTWSDYCHDLGLKCFVSEMSPPEFETAEKAGTDCAMFFDLWGSAGGEYAAANEDGTATEIGKAAGDWIKSNTN